MALNILVIGDIVGKLGRQAVAGVVPRLRDEHNIGLVIANGENAAGGRGMTPATVDEIRGAGIDVITSGNHIWAKKEVFGVLNDPEQPVIRPLNYPDGAPGRGIYRGDGVAVINLIGRTFMGDAVDCPFRAADRALAEVGDMPVVIVDMHAEATSEKIAIGRYLDGRATAVVGTHTHVPTCDQRVLARGTAYVSDLGMVGARESVLGMEYEPVLARFLTQLPSRWEPVDKGPATFNSVLISADDAGRATQIKRVDCEVAG